jgi:predicted nuclease of predicted toxin-antitoxin system
MVDASAGFRLAEWAKSQAHDVVFTPDLGEDPGDDVLLRRAYDEKRVVITLDRNFGKSIFTEGAASPGIVILPWVPHEQRLVLLESALAAHIKELENGCVVVAEQGRFRLRTPPGYEDKGTATP